MVGVASTFPAASRIVMEKLRQVVASLFVTATKVSSRLSNTFPSSFFHTAPLFPSSHLPPRDFPSGRIEEDIYEKWLSNRRASQPSLLLTEGITRKTHFSAGCLHAGFIDKHRLKHGLIDCKAVACSHSRGNQHSYYDTEGRGRRVFTLGSNERESI